MAVAPVSADDPRRSPGRSTGGAAARTRPAAARLDPPRFSTRRANRGASANLERAVRGRARASLEKRLVLVAVVGHDAVRAPVLDLWLKARGQKSGSLDVAAPASLGPRVLGKPPRPRARPVQHGARPSSQGVASSHGILSGPACGRTSLVARRLIDRDRPVGTSTRLWTQGQGQSLAGGVGEMMSFLGRPCARVVRVG